MIGPGLLLYLPVGIWVATGTGLVLAYRRSTPPLLLRLAATFLALWALLATTVLVWVLANGGWSAILALLQSPGLLFENRFWGVWLLGGLGALLLLTTAFLVNQLVGWSLLRVLRPEPLAWPPRLPTPSTRTSLLRFESPRAEAFSFTLLDPGLRVRSGPHRHEIILLSGGLLELLTADETEAVVAHELGHVRGLDSRYLTFLRTFARMMRWDPLLAYLAWSLTRREEYRADWEAAHATHRPLALARALYKALSVGSLMGSGGSAAFLGLGGRRGRREALERIRRLLWLADSGIFEGEQFA